MFMSTQLEKDVLYPDSDGKPMAESDIHCDRIINILVMLKDRYRKDPNVYVAGNLFLYFEEGNPRRNVAPDVMVVLGVEKKYRRSYKVWAEGKAPDMIIEVTSDSTQYEDLYAKKELYRELGVKEYYLFDPTGDYLSEPLQAYHLVEGEYQPVPSEGGFWRSPVLGLTLKAEGGHLRLYDAQTGEPLLDPAAQSQAREQAEVERRRAEAARQQAETALGQAETARQQAETAREQAEAACRREAEARQAAEVELQRLRTELARLKKPLP